MPSITADELFLCFTDPADREIPRAAWVQGFADGHEPTCDDDTLCELACERDPAGPAATIRGLIDGLLMRHADDPATVAALTAIGTYHLPDLMESRG